MPSYTATTMHTYLHRMHKRQNWYTPSIGTIGMAMAHRFARHATDGPSLWTIEDIALTFGIGNSAARVWRSLDRLDRFGIIHRTGDRITVRLDVAEDDWGKVIGRGGRIASAMRSLVKVAAVKEGVRANLEIGD